MIESPAQYTFAEIKIGTKAKFDMKIDEKMISEFATFSGDHNPLHVDKNYAATTSFRKPICHGMLLGSFFSRLVGMYLPGKNALYFSQTLNFQAPCFAGDVISVEGEVIDKSDATRIITLKTAIYNQQGNCLVDGIAKVIVRDNVQINK
ncbi:MAG: MaoC family dehydratase [Candidatus Nitrosotenuis sp.]